MKNFLNKTIKRFSTWAHLLNPSFNIIYQPLVITLNSGWLSGFIEAEGGFYARVRKNKRCKIGYQFMKKFYLSQKDELELLQTILKLFQSNAKVYTFEQKTKVYHRIEISSLSSHSLVLQYLEAYPLFGRKNVSLYNWKRMHGYQERNEHLCSKGLLKLKHLCRLLRKNNNYFE